MKKTAILLAYLLAYLLVLGAINFVHFRYLTVNVVFYSALADAVIAALVLGIAAVGLRSFGKPDSFLGGAARALSATEMVLAAVITILIGYICAISIPTVIDRSFSIYILEKLDQRGGEISLRAMRDIVLEEFMREHRLIDARMTEQLNSGTLVIDGDCVRLTSRGQRIVAFTRFYRTTLLPKRRLLMGEVTGDLTDPFREPTSAVHYGCQEQPVEGAGQRE